MWHLIENLYDPEECWIFTGRLDKDGYGKAKAAGKMRSVHRWIWTCTMGWIPPEVQLDHLCKNRACCNPNHLEEVDNVENTRRAENANRNKTHCPKGHEYTEANTRMSQGRRKCRTCEREGKRRATAVRQATGSGRKAS